MGANASTAVPLYASGQVLDAARLNLTNCGVPVFSGTATRDGAFGGSGEKTLAEGQLCYLEDSNVVQYYDGAAFQTVGPTPGLVCVKAETAFTGVTSVTADNVFTSSYTNYLIFISATGTGANQIFFQLRVGGVTAATNYNEQRFTSSSTTNTGGRLSSQTSLQVASVRSGLKISSSFVVLGPQIADVTNLYANSTDYSGTVVTAPTIDIFASNHSTATAYDGFILTVAAAMTGSYAVYGYSKTV